MRWLGMLLAVVIPVALGTSNAACMCGPSGPTNPDECRFRGDPGGEMRTLQLGFVPDPTDGMPSPEFVEYTTGAIVPKVRGFQGADMLVTEMRVPADSSDDTDNRCVRVRYRRSGAGDASYEVDLELVRQGDWWVARRAIFDPTDDFGAMQLDVTIDDSQFTATGSASIELVSAD